MSIRFKNAFTQRIVGRPLERVVPEATWRKMVAVINAADHYTLGKSGTETASAYTVFHNKMCELRRHLEKQT